MFEQIANILTNINSNKIRSGSKKKGSFETNFFIKINRKKSRLILLAAKKYDLKNKQFGKKNGALGAVAIQILEYFVNCINFKTGQLDPSINTIMKKIGRSRDAIYRALNNLKNHGFLNWIRRYVPTGKSYPSLEQTSNAYQLNLPKEAEALINFSPLADDIKSSIEEKYIQHQEYEQQTVNIPEMWGIENQSLHGALLSLFENIKGKNSEHNCESVIRTEYQFNYINNQKSMKII